MGWRNAISASRNKVTRFEIPIVCHQCGELLDIEGVNKLNDLQKEYRLVLPWCTGQCSNAPGDGWITKGKTKEGVLSDRPGSAKRVRERGIDLSTYTPRAIGDSMESLYDWLTDSKPAWNQLLFKKRTSRRIKKRRKR